MYLYIYAYTYTHMCYHTYMHVCICASYTVYTLSLISLWLLISINQLLCFLLCLSHLEMAAGEKIKQCHYNFKPFSTL